MDRNKDCRRDKNRDDQLHWGKSEMTDSNKHRQAWMCKPDLNNLLNVYSTSAFPGTTQRQQSELLVKKIHDLTKSFVVSQLNNLALETMIEVAESDIHIIDLKERGTEQSKECGKSDQNLPW